MKKNLIFTAASIAVAGLALAGCGKSSSAEDTKDDGKLMTVTLFDEYANYQGIQPGWFGKLIKDKFNIKLNIIAPNVAGGGSTLFDTRSAAGNLGDLIMVNASGNKGSRLAKSGLLTDMTPYAKNLKYLQKYKTSINALNKTLGKKSGMWGIPTAVSAQSPTTPQDGSDPTFGPYLRWDIYKEIGYPKMKNMDDVLNVLKEMQAKARQKTGDNKIYALSLFKDWDGDTMSAANQLVSWFGYSGVGNVFAKADGSDNQSAIQTNGIYEKMLQFLNKANQLGLVDPESATQNSDAQNTKMKRGRVLFSPVAWTKAGYNTGANVNVGRGFEFAPLTSLQSFSQGQTPNGQSFFFAIGSKAKNKPRLAKFLNWLYSPDGIYVTRGLVNGTAGIKGWTWEMKNGKPQLTSYGNEIYFGDNNAAVPAKYGTGQFSDGASQMNTTTVSNNDIDPSTKYPYNPDLWPATQAKINSTPVAKDWVAHMGTDTAMEYVKKHNNLLVAPGASYVMPDDSSQISTLRSQIRTQIVNYSWRLVFAKSDNGFDSLFKKMQSTVNGLDYAKVLKADMQNAKEQQKARVQIVKDYKDKN